MVFEESWECVLKHPLLASDWIVYCDVSLGTFILQQRFSGKRQTSKHQTLRIKSKIIKMQTNRHADFDFLCTTAFKTTFEKWIWSTLKFQSFSCARKSSKKICCRSNFLFAWFAYSDARLLEEQIMKIALSIAALCKKVLLLLL